MKKEILIDREKGLTRVAILEDEELCEFYLEREGAEKLAGNIYKGRVQNVLRGMQAAFVDIGTGKNAFLYLGDEGPDKRDLAFPGQEAQVPAARQERVVANQDLLVQVVKEPDGTKGARLSTHITLPGRYVVLAPQMDYVGVSRRIAQEGERQRLKAEAERVKPAGMGLIVRTAAEGRSGEDFLEDVRELTALWEQIVGRVRAGRAPCCVHRDEDLITRTLPRPSACGTRCACSRRRCPSAWTAMRAGCRSLTPTASRAASKRRCRRRSGSETAATCTSRRPRR